MSRVVVIGAGLAGLSAGCRLLAAGHQVTLVERDRQVGGRAGRLTQDGFTFDTGPTVLTMPELIDDTLRTVGTSLADRLTLRPVQPAYRGRFADGSTIDVHTDTEAMAAEIARTCGPRDAEQYTEFVGWLQRLFELEFDRFIDADYSTPLDLARSPITLARLVRMGAFGRLGPLVSDRIADPRLQRLLSFQSLYVGLSPEDALAIYAVITYLDSVAGVWFPEGGIHAVPEALAAAFTDAGGTIVLDQPVIGLITGSGRRARGVRTADGDLEADAVVCTDDLSHAYATLLRDLRPPRAVRAGHYSPSAVVWHVGVDGVPDDRVRHHNIHFGAHWQDSFGEMLDHGRLMTEPSRLVTVPSLDHPGAAPPGCSTLYVLEPVPNLSGSVDWVREREPMRDRLHRFLTEAGYPDTVRTERLMTPLDWYGEGLAHGTPFSLAHTFAQTGPFRPANHDRRVPGLFFAGAGTVPGVGVPMVIISGRLAAQRTDRYLRSRRSPNSRKPKPIMGAATGNADADRPAAETRRR